MTDLRGAEVLDDDPHTPTRSSPGWIVAVVTAVAAVLRLLPLLAQGVTGRSFVFDESVYFIAAQQLWSGVLPYRDFVFVHPPGLPILLGPFVWLAHLIPDAAALTVAQVVFASIGAACAGIVAYLLLRYGRFAAAIGGGLYAVWSGAVLGETSVMMEPILSIALLIALLCLRRGRFVLVGAVLGAAVVVKLWALIPLTVIMIWIAVRHGRAAALRAGAGAFLTALVAVAAFLVASPGRMIADVVGFQLGRPRSDVGSARRAEAFAGDLVAYDVVPSVCWLVAGLVIVLLVATPLVRALAARRAPRSWSDPVWWSVLTLVWFVALAAAPTFYDHYAAVTAPGLCLSAGYGAHVLWDRLAGVRWRVGVSAAAGVAATALAVATAEAASLRPVQPSGVAAVVDGRECVWAYDPAVLVAAGRSGDAVARHCGMIVDRYATAMRELAVTDAEFDAALPDASDYQAMIAEQWRESDAVVLTARQLFELAPETLAVLQRDFARAAVVDGCQVWLRE